MAHPNRLNNARVLVFGGTSGIGFAVASLALSQGAYVTISGSRQPKVDDKVSVLRNLYPSISADKVSGHAVDLADTPNLETNLKALFDKVTSNGERKIDHIAFTASDALAPPLIQDVVPDTALAGAKVRILGILTIAKLLSKGIYMPASPASSLTFTSGTIAKRPFPGSTIIATLGGAVEGLMRGLAVDLKPIRVNLVEPGAIETELLATVGKTMGKDSMEMFKRQTLLGTLGQPNDTAEAYGWFMRDHYVTGSVAQTDGGRLLSG